MHTKTMINSLVARIKCIARSVLHDSFQGLLIAGRIPMPHVNVGIPLLAGLLAYGGIIREKMVDMKSVLRRGTVFVLSVVVIALVFFSVEFCVEKFFYSNDEVVDIVSAVIGAFVFCRVKLYFEAMTDNIFFRGGYDYADATARASELFSETIDLDILVATIEKFLGETIKPGWIDFFRKDEASSRGFSPVSEDASSAMLDDSYAQVIESFFRNEGGSRKDFEFPPISTTGKSDIDNTACDSGEVTILSGIGAIVPTFSRGRMNALLIMGRKKSGDPFSSRDKKLLAVISRQIDMALENAALYEAVKRHAEDLERHVVERTERIKNMYEAQSKFLADLSHEFQTPLTILKMNVELFAKKSASERRKAAYVMETTLDRLSRLTRGLVDIARFNFFKEVFQRRKIDLPALFKEVCDDCTVLANDRGVTLSHGGDACFVLGDWDKLKEVMLNLVSNALKHTTAGGSVVLSARRGEGEAEISVTDSGNGIDSKNLPLIFERFYRINDGMSEGAGLGLHLCRKIIEAHGGTIVAESSVGRGSRFVIHLPMVDDPDLPSESPPRI